MSTARTAERAAALWIVFQHLAETDRVARVQQALVLISQGEWPVDGLLVCRSGSALVGAIQCQSLAGAAGLLWPPQICGATQLPAVENMLVESAIRWLRDRGAKFAQAYVEIHELPIVAPLERHGFRRITSLLSLHKTLLANEAPHDIGANLRFESYSQSNALIFKEILLRSYEGTLDCPELNDLRSAEEIVAGYSAAPNCLLQNWWLAFFEDHPVGVLILIPTRDRAIWELAYLGLAPHARRKGLGREMTRKAIGEARHASAERLMLSVDARNEPARRMYKSLQFEEFERREVFLTIL